LTYKLNLNLKNYVLIVVGFSNHETALRNLRRGSQIENIGFEVKNRETGYVKPSKAKKEKEKRFKVCSKVSSWAKLPLSVHNVIEQSSNTSRSELFPRERERERESINPLLLDAYQMSDFPR